MTRLGREQRAIEAGAGARAIEAGAGACACDECEPLMINGVFCHETGCPNAGKTWVRGRGWVLFVDCWDCGHPVEAGEVCGCQEIEAA